MTGTVYGVQVRCRSLVQFLGGDMDRPIVTGALYNGQSEGGLARFVHRISD